jgi:hypothetical protein
MNTLHASESPAGSASPSPDAIERDIEATRRALDRTLEQLQARLSPRVRLEEALSNARESGGRLAGEMGQLARRYPVPFVVIGATLLVAIVAGARTHRRH